MDDRYSRVNGAPDNSDRARLSRLLSRDNPNEPQRPQYAQMASSMPSTSQGGVVIYSPSTYEDVQLLIDHLKMREQVIVDFSTLNQASVYRILDFMSGAIYALSGSIQQITKNIFLFAPAGVTITVPPQLGRNGR
ncbi:MAG: cell division protein SepF [Clostridia bacterium]|nr:cell division protein SepF [Clostridia bacterium]